MSVLEWWHLLLSGSEGPDFRAGSRMSEGSGTAGCPGWRGRMSGACTVLAAERLWWVKLQGPDVRGRGRMSRAWEVSLTPSVGFLYL